MTSRNTAAKGDRSLWRGVQADCSARGGFSFRVRRIPLTAEPFLCDWIFAPHRQTMGSLVSDVIGINRSSSCSTEAGTMPHGRRPQRVNSYLKSLGKSGLADFLARMREKINASDSRPTIAIKAKLIGYSSLPFLTDILGRLFPSSSSIFGCEADRFRKLGRRALPRSTALGNIERSIVSINRRLNCQGKRLVISNELPLAPSTKWWFSLRCCR